MKLLIFQLPSLAAIICAFLLLSQGIIYCFLSIGF